MPITAFSQSSDSVLINEIELNPPGFDSGGAKEFVELYNPLDYDVDVSGWIISPSKFSFKNLVIPENSVIPKNGFLVLTHVGFWFSDSGDSIILKNSSDEIIDSTPELQDQYNDMMTWQRITDGFDSNSDSDWVLKLSTPNSSNGKTLTVKEDLPITVSVKLEKEHFHFDDTVIISGDVSSEVFVERPTFFQEPILITVSSQNGFTSNFNLYPDKDLQYSVPLKIQKVLGFDEGTYLVNVEYAGASTSTQFIIIPFEQIISEKEEFQLTFDTVKESYLPGETVVLSGNINTIQNLSKISLDIFDPNGKLFTSGNIFPNSLGELNFKVFLPTVNTSFGKYIVDISYYESDKYGYSTEKKSLSTSFLVIQDILENEIISLNTNKSVYGLGETIFVTGRSNSHWVPSLDFIVLQTGTQAFLGDQSDDVGSQDPFKLNDVVRLNGDRTFSYDLKIPNIPERLGDYKISVSKEFGSSFLNFVISDDPENHIFDELPFKLNIDKNSYSPNEKIKISGKIFDIQKRFGVLSPIEMSFFTSQGKQLEIKSCLGDNNDECDVHIPFILTSFPDLAGNFNNDATLFVKLFKPGKYTLKASFEELTEFRTFEITSLESSTIDEQSIPPIILTLNKTTFNIGETLHVSGNVALANISPDSDDLYTTSQHTDFQLAQHNQVRVLIPYPLYITTNPDASVSTSTTDEFSGGSNRGSDPGKGGYDGVITYNKSISLLSGFESKIFPKPDGSFSTSFNLRPGVFFDGEYVVKATYHGKSVEIPIHLVDSTLTGGKKPILNISADKSTYLPGDVVNIIGSVENVFYFDSVELVVKNEMQSKQNCLRMDCGLGNTAKKLRVHETTGTFSTTFVIPEGIHNIGKYEITAKTHFGTTKSQFDVVDGIESESSMKKQNITKIIDKVSRILDSNIEINMDEKISQQNILQPRVLQGSLFTPIRGAESDVNIKLMTDSGVCVIGQKTSCLISDSTRAPGKIFKIIQIEGKSYKVRYSGPDAKLEKFSILPENDSDVLQKSSWNVEVSKDDQPSRFYYKISYLKTE